jgi:hypothetical protein
MTTSDSFVQEFKRLLEGIPNDISLQQLQYDYREIALLMGIKILAQFPQVMIGLPPSPQHEASSAEMARGGAAPDHEPYPNAGSLPHSRQYAASGPWIGPIPHQSAPHEFLRWVITLMGGLYDDWR